MRFLILFISLLFSYSLLAVTKEELRLQTEDVIRRHQQQKQRLHNNELLDHSAEFYYDGNQTYPGLVINGIIYPAVIRSNYRYPACLIGDDLVIGEYDTTTEKVLCQVDPPSVTTDDDDPPPPSPKAKQPAKRVKSVVNKVKQQQKQQQTYYQTGNQAQVMEVNAFQSNRKFGIKAGTWARVYLARAVSSSEPVDIELELLEDVVGLYKTLPSGTIFFTRHSINPISQRLDMEVAFMVLPDGQEMPLSATIHSSGGGAGLAGAVITHSDTVAKSSARKNLLTGTQQVLDQTNDPFSSIAGEVANDVIESKKQLIPTSPGFSIQLAVQEALIRFRRSF